MKIIFKSANEIAAQTGQTKTTKSSEIFLAFKERFDGQARAQFAICSLSRFDHFAQDNR
jgi:hypothetical protein